MRFTAKAFAHKLSAMRDGFGQGVSDVSSATGIPSPRLESLEGGAVVPTGDEILMLADHFRRDFRFLIDDDSSDPDTSLDVIFRRHGGELSPADRIAIAEFAYLCRCQAQMEADLGGSKPQEAFSFTPRGNYFKGHADQCLRQLREALQLGPANPPRDLFASMRMMGFKVFRRRLENSRISGLFLNDVEAGPCILVNLADGMARQRFSAAHEWAHALMDKEKATLSMVGEWNSRDLVEVRANTFASLLLIPPDFLDGIDAEKWTKPASIVEIASRLRVSVQALLVALVSSKKISEEQRQFMQDAAPRAPMPADPELEGDSTSEQLARKRDLLHRGLSQHYVSLCFDAYARGNVTLGLLSEMLLTTAGGVQEIADAFGRSVGHG
jgi:Zn-dependent peptidase ImmA (M78 family)